MRSQHGYKNAGGMVQMIIPSPVPFIALWFVGAALGIIYGARPKKRRKYVLKVLGFYLGLFGGYALFFFFQELIAHHERRKAFKRLMAFKKGWEDGENNVY